MRWIVVAAILPFLPACAAGPSAAPVRAAGPQLPPGLPDSVGFGTHVLALARSPDGEMWVGTYGHGIYLLPADTGGAAVPVRGRATAAPAQRTPAAWRRIQSRANDSTSISWNFVNSFGFTSDSTSVWYGTVGNGFGRSRDGGQTWKNWTVSRLGPEWQYVTPDGIRTQGDTVFIATADGLRITWDDGDTWRCIQAADRVAGGAAPRSDACAERIQSLPSDYLLALDVGPEGDIWVGHLKGVSVSKDLGRTWTAPDSKSPIDVRVRAIEVSDTMTFVAGETAFYRGAPKQPLEKVEPRAPGWPALPGAPRVTEAMPGTDWPLIGTSFGLAAPSATGEYHVHYLPAGERYRPAADVWAVLWWGFWPLSGTGTGINRILAGEFPALPPAARGNAPEAPRHVLFGRPIAGGDGNPFIDATYRYGSTMGGNFQQHQGVEFNNPAGTPVRAVADGVVVFAGKAEQGANTIAIRHDQRLEAQYVFSVYYHNASLNARLGQRVRAGEVIARVGNTGRATNEHLHLEIHVAPQTDSSLIVNPEQRFPPHTVNPQLWIEPMPGTGIVAGRVFDAAGQPVAGARIYGLVQPYPEETPLSFVETYGDRAHSDPAYQEHFAIGDVPAGEYMLGTEIGGKKIWRRINVQPGRVTFVEFRPE
ncbi:MAG TPA: peptidoglycan DD-metalloendopeptidase family protein [Longimicrobiales bacterium]|nr:peptidoglycan DD-metalloendopeptidase family protein [Longimicrobiales bacterium]